MRRSREWLFENIRKTRREESLPGRAPAQRFTVSRNTVKTALESPVPPERRKPPRPSAPEPVKGFIDAMPREDVSAAHKQRHTVSRITGRWAAEHDFEPGLLKNGPLHDR